MGKNRRLIWIDGKFVPWEEATVHVLSHSHQRGSLVFDYLAVYDTPAGPSVFRLNEHVERFLISIDLVGLPLSWTRENITEAILDTIRQNPNCRAVKISAYLASIEVDIVPANAHVTLAVAAYDPIGDILERKELEETQSKRPLKIWLEKEIRSRRKDILPPQAKVAAAYASPMAAKWSARRRGFDDVIFIDADGNLAEGPTNNVFLVDSKGVLRTPPDETVLLGVTRKSIIEIAGALGYQVSEAPLRPEELLSSKEAFITGTTAGLWPIGSVDGQVISRGSPGSITKILGATFKEIVQGENTQFSHWLTPVFDSSAGG